MVDHDVCRRCGVELCRGGAACNARVDALQARGSAAKAPTREAMYQRKRDGRLFEVVIQARSPDGPCTLRSVDDPPETVETTNDRVLVDFEDLRRVYRPAPTPHERCGAGARCAAMTLALDSARQLGANKPGGYRFRERTTPHPDTDEDVTRIVIDDDVLKPRVVKACPWCAGNPNEQQVMR